MRGIGWNRFPGCLGPGEQVCSSFKDLRIIKQACGHPIIGRGPQWVWDRRTASGTEVRTKAAWSDVGRDVLSSGNPAEIWRFHEDWQTPLVYDKESSGTDKPWDRCPRSETRLLHKDNYLALCPPQCRGGHEPIQATVEIWILLSRFCCLDF